MKTSSRTSLRFAAVFALPLGLKGSVLAQVQVPESAVAQAVAADTNQPPAWTADELDQLLGPIALYPDPLLSDVLAAATYPQDIPEAADWAHFIVNPFPTQVDTKSWDPSVKTLLRFPGVLDLLAANRDWTQAVASAFAQQPSEVINSVQRLRGRAEAAQTLVSSPEQQVMKDAGVISIVPTMPDVIYVPAYDPQVVYSPPAVAGSYITFEPPASIIMNLDLDLDFAHGRLVRNAPFDLDQHRANFDHAQPWVRDPGRPIPAPPMISRPSGDLSARLGAAAAPHGPGALPTSQPRTIPPIVSVHANIRACDLRGHAQVGTT